MKAVTLQSDVYKRQDIPSFIHGGSQERGKRAGTENVAGIVGMAKAAEIAYGNIRIYRRWCSGRYLFRGVRRLSILLHIWSRLPR